MIPPDQTNFVYFSELLLTDKRFAQTCMNLASILARNGISYGFLKETKDIWCKDYMPIQVNFEGLPSRPLDLNRPENVFDQRENASGFVQFRYQPRYLDAYPELHTESDQVTRSLGIDPIKSTIKLDGGNLIQWKDKVLISDMVFLENPQYESKIELLKEIEELLQSEVIIFPRIRRDYTGHVDGMLRFVNAKTLIGNDRKSEYSCWSKGINRVLKQHGMDYIDLPFFTQKDTKYPNTAIGCYTNYLEVGNLIVLPVFEITGNRDEEVLEIFRQTFSHKVIVPLNINEIAKFGGLLNCITWTVQKKTRTLGVRSIYSYTGVHLKPTTTSIY